MQACMPITNQQKIDPQRCLAQNTRTDYRHGQYVLWYVLYSIMNATHTDNVRLTESDSGIFCFILVTTSPSRCGWRSTTPSAKISITISDCHSNQLTLKQQDQSQVINSLRSYAYKVSTACTCFDGPSCNVSQSIYITSYYQLGDQPFQEENQQSDLSYNFLPLFEKPSSQLQFHYQEKWDQCKRGMLLITRCQLKYLSCSSVAKLMRIN